MKYEESMLSGYLDGELNPEERLVVERHLERHPKDRDTLRALASLKQSLATLPAEAFSVDPVAAVRSRIAVGGPPCGTSTGAPDPQPSPRSSTHWRLWIPLALAASLVAVATLAFSGRRWRATTLVATDITTDKQPSRNEVGRSLDNTANRGLERELQLDWESPEKAQKRNALGDRLDSASTSEWKFKEPLGLPVDRAAPTSPAAAPQADNLFSREPGEPAPAPVAPSLALKDESRDKAPAGRVLEEEDLAEQSGSTPPSRLRRAGTFDADKPSSVVWYKIRHPAAPSDASPTRLSDSQPSAEESIVFDVPEGQTELALRWITDRMNVPQVDEPQPLRGPESQAGEPFNLGKLPSGAIAVRVDAPPSELAGLVQSLRQLLAKKGAGDGAAAAGLRTGIDALEDNSVARADYGNRALRLAPETLGPAAAPSGGAPSNGIHAGAAAAEAVRQGSVWIILRPQPRNAPEP